MPKLIINSGSLAGTHIDLKPGVNRVGRNADNDAVLPEASISNFHCELHVAEIGISVRDLNSSNGSFINGKPIQKAFLQHGDTLTLGQIECTIELPDVQVAIPQLQSEEPLGAAFLADGTPACFNHRDAPAVVRCTGCENWWCAACVRQLKRLSGDFLLFCPNCSAACVSVPRETAAAKKSFLSRLTETLRLPRKR